MITISLSSFISFSIFSIILLISAILANWLIKLNLASNYHCQRLMRQPAEVLFADEQVTSKKASRSSAFQAPNKRVKLSNGGSTIKANGKTNGYLEQKVPKNRYTLPSSLKKNEVLNHQPRCDCCPHGFHLDLGFVKFAEDVATGKEQIQVSIRFTNQAFLQII